MGHCGHDLVVVFPKHLVERHLLGGGVEVWGDESADAALAGGVTPGGGSSEVFAL